MSLCAAFVAVAPALLCTLCSTTETGDNC